MAWEVRGNLDIGNMDTFSSTRKEDTNLCCLCHFFHVDSLHWTCRDFNFCQSLLVLPRSHLLSALLTKCVRWILIGKWSLCEGTIKLWLIWRLYWFFFCCELPRVCTAGVPECYFLHCHRSLTLKPSSKCVDNFLKDCSAIAACKLEVQQPQQPHQPQQQQHQQQYVPMWCLYSSGKLFGQFTCLKDFNSFPVQSCVLLVRGTAAYWNQILNVPGGSSDIFSITVHYAEVGDIQF